ncbi:MAG: hypothetical protein IJ960_06700 [Oscillospiraceae bacterium]|nr:hypothetical protein [Oscillospiraceae bacterium]
MYWYHYTDPIYYGGGFDNLSATNAICGPIEYNGRLYGTKNNPIYRINYVSGILTQKHDVYPVAGAEMSNYYCRVFGQIESGTYKGGVAKEIPGATISGKYRFSVNIADGIYCGFSIPCNFLIVRENGTTFVGNSIRAIGTHERNPTYKYCGIVWDNVGGNGSVSWGAAATGYNAPTSYKLPQADQNCVIDFGAAEQEIPAFLLEWIEHNADKVAADSAPLTIIMTRPEGIRMKTEERYCDRDIAVIPKLQAKTVTENGVYSADSGNVALSSVTVAVPDGVWESMQAGTLTEFSSAAASIVGALAGCTTLIKADLIQCAALAVGMFRGCSALTALILRLETMVIAGSDVCTDTPIASGGGYIYVPSALVASYQADTVWSAYAAQFRALEDYTTDGTITGALDDTKI